MKEAKIFIIVIALLIIGALVYSFIPREHYGTVTERICNDGVETVTVETEAGKIADVKGDYPINSQVTVTQNNWSATATGIGE